MEAGGFVIQLATLATDAVEVLATVVIGFVVVVVTEGIIVTANVVVVVTLLELVLLLMADMGMLLAGFVLTISVMVGLVVVIAKVVKFLSSRPLSAVPATTRCCVAVVVVVIVVEDCFCVAAADVVGNTIVAVTFVNLSVVSPDFALEVFSLRKDTTLSLGLNSALIKGCLLGLSSAGVFAASPAFVAFNILGPGRRVEIVAVFIGTTAV